MIGGILSAVGGVFSFFSDALSALMRRRDREAGRNEQKAVEARDRLEKASEAMKIDEDVNRMSDSDVTGGLRKYARRDKRSL